MSSRTCPTSTRSASVQRDTNAKVPRTTDVRAHLHRLGCSNARYTWHATGRCCSRVPPRSGLLPGDAPCHSRAPHPQPPCAPSSDSQCSRGALPIRSKWSLDFFAGPLGDTPVKVSLDGREKGAKAEMPLRDYIATFSGGEGACSEGGMSCAAGADVTGGGGTPFLRMI